MEEIFITFL